GVVQTGLTLVVSLSITAIIAVTMIWLGAWHPKMLLVVAVGYVLSCAARVRHAPRAMHRTRVSAERGAWLQLTLLPLGLVAWAFGVSPGPSRGTISSYGLLES